MRGEEKNGDGTRDEAIITVVHAIIIVALSFEAASLLLPTAVHALCSLLKLAPPPRWGTRLEPAEQLNSNHRVGRLFYKSLFY